MMTFRTFISRFHKKNKISLDNSSENIFINKTGMTNLIKHF